MHLASPFAAFRTRLSSSTIPTRPISSSSIKGALALIMPSKLEGWGLPAGEALWCGTPVICSTAEALQEVCGNLGLYFPPDDAVMLADIIARLMNDQGFRLAVSERICEARHSLRTWRAVAQDVS